MANSEAPPDPETVDADDADVARALTAIAECALELETSALSAATYDDWRHRERADSLEEYPSLGYIRSHCGSWGAAKERLGLDPCPRGGGTPPDLDDSDVDWQWDDLEDADGRDLDDLSMSAWYCATLLVAATL